MPAIARATILERLRAMIDRRVPIIGGGAGTGLSAKCEEAGGIDLIVIYNSGRYRMAGRGSAAGLLAYGNANEIVHEMAAEVLPVVRHTPVLAGVNATDPFVLLPRFLAELKELGFSGVQNFPTVGLFDGSMRVSFEETGMGFGLEVDMIAAAHALDLLTTPYVFNPDEARDMVRAGADIVVAHMGVTTGGAIGAKTGKSLDACAGEIDAIAAAARAVRSDIIVLCHGGPIAAPADAEYVLRRVDRCHGFYGASSMERLPAEAAITRQTADFKAITFGDVSGGDAKRDGHPHGNLVHPDDVRAFGFDWGQLALTVGPEVNGAKNFSGGVVRLPPGEGHSRHHHPDAEEIIFVVSGHGEQMVEDEAGVPVRRPAGPGCTIYVPQGRFHATENTGTETMVFFVVYSPAGPEIGLRDLPDFRLL